MATLPGFSAQPQLDELLNFRASITTGGTAQLLLPQHPRRKYLLLENTAASGNFTIGVGPATATATISNGAVTAVTGVNNGIGYTVAPQVVLLGGLVTGDLGNMPANPAVVTATISAGAISGYAVNSGGAGYVVAPTVFLLNPLPQLGGGAFVPSASAGVVLVPNGSWLIESSVVTTSAIAIFHATTGATIECLVGLNPPN